MMPSSRRRRSTRPDDRGLAPRAHRARSAGGRRGARTTCIADGRRHPPQTGEHAGRRTGDEPAGMGGALDRRSAARACRGAEAMTNTPFVGGRSTPRVEQAHRCVERPTPWSRNAASGDHTVVGGEPRRGEPAGRSDMAILRTTGCEGDVGAGHRTRGVRAPASECFVRAAPARNTPMHETLGWGRSGVAAVAGFGEAEEAEEEEADGGGPQDDAAPAVLGELLQRAGDALGSRSGRAATAATRKKMPEIASTTERAA